MNNSNKPTPGKWFHHGASGSQHTMGGFISNTEDRYASPAICDVRGTDGQPFLANARLIAAAPDLLEALQFVMSAHGEQLETAFEMAQTAIAKATGEAE